MDAARLTGPPEPWHLGFLLGPRINAGGRIGRADLGARLLLENDPSEAGRLAAELDRLNHERRQIEASTLAQAEAEALAALGLEEKGAVVVTAGEGWHPGVVGLVAARLKERYGRPAFAIALEAGGSGTGSGRSITGVDLGRVVRQAVREGLLLKGGGHAMAAGVTLKKNALGAFRAYLEEALAPSVEVARRDRALLIDGAVSAGAVNVALCELLSRAGPYGAGNPEPVLALPAHTLSFADPVGENHIRARFRSGDGKFVNAIAFRAAGTPLGRALLDGRGRALHAAGTLTRRPLAGRGAGADAADRRRGKLSRYDGNGGETTKGGSGLCVWHIARPVTALSGEPSARKQHKRLSPRPLLRGGNTAEKNRREKSSTSRQRFRALRQNTS